MSLKQQFYQDSSRVSTKTGSSRGSDNTFDDVTQTPIAGRLIVTIVEGQKLNVSNYQSRPYCVCEFERNEVVTREAMRHSDLPNQRSKPMDFLDLFRAATTPVWKHKAVFDVARLDSKVHVSVYERVHNNAQSENFLGMFKVQPPRRPNQTIDAWFKLSPRGKENVTGKVRVQISYEKIEVYIIITCSFYVEVNDFEKSTSLDNTLAQSYVSHYSPTIHKRRNRRKLRKRTYALYWIERLPVQVTNDPFTNNIFNGTPF
ncbi:unnamed protein product [Rhizophagus irregularis]|nr:unnamed protein product [Rhizophagus irregularis]